MNISSEWIDVQGLRIHYLRAGEQGSPVVLLHGGGIDSSILSWELAIPALAEHHRVIAPDLPGYGESDKPDIEYTTEFYLRFLGAFLDAVGLQRTSLAGLSMGGGIALGFALQSPERVDKLVLVDSYGLQTKAPLAWLGYLMVHMPGYSGMSMAMMRSRWMIRYSLRALLHNRAAVTEKLVDQAMAEVQRPRAVLAFNSYQKAEVLWNGTRTCYLDQLPGLHVPTLIVHGAEDTLVPIACARQAHELIPGSQLHFIQSAGHWVQRDCPEEFNRIVGAFLDQA